MPTRIPDSPRCYGTACVPVRFEGEHVIFACLTRIACEDPFSTMYGESDDSVLRMEIPVSLGDSDSIGE